MITGMLILFSVLALPGGEVFEGTLDPELSLPSKAGWRIESLPPATAKERSRLPIPLTEQDLVWTGMIGWRGSGGQHQAALVDRPKGEKHLLLDINGNGKFEPAEVFQLFPANDAESGFERRFRFRSASGPFPAFPVAFHMPGSRPKPGEPQSLGIEDAVQITGTVEIEGRQVRVALGYYPDEVQIQLDRVPQAMDLDGDGVADLTYSSPESDVPLNDTPVFRLGELYLSFAKVDLKKLRFTLRTRKPSDYVRIELVRGTAVPDFQFVDLTGKKWQLSDFRGRYVLLDFWGSWCAGCVEGLPRLRALYSQYKDRGFEIVGMTHDESESAAKKVLAKNGCQWVNARPSSVLTLVKKRFRITSFPTLVLLDPEGNVYAKVHHEGLEEILQKVLPEK